MTDATMEPTIQVQRVATGPSAQPRSGDWPASGGNDLAYLAGWWGVVEVPAIRWWVVVDKEDVAVAGD
jgi:hypothetical protein